MEKGKKSSFITKTQNFYTSNFIFKEKSFKIKNIQRIVKLLPNLASQAESK